MKGKYDISIWDNKVRYDLEIKRQVTIIKGKSGSGKSTLYSMVEDMLTKGRVTGIHCNCKNKLRVLTLNGDYKSEIASESGKIFVLDEYFDFVCSQDFAEAVDSSDNYFIIISRSGRLKWLTYGVNEIYELNTSKSTNGVSITRMYKKYTDNPTTLTPDIIITEDSNSGCEMFRLVFPDKRVEPAGGKDNVYNVLEGENFNCAYIIVDGAGFGSSIGRIFPKYGSSVHIFAPESFEYLLLQSNAFKNCITRELIDTYNYCDSTSYLSWERYYTDLINTLMQTEYRKSYSKKKLSAFFETDYYINFIRSLVPDNIK